MASSSAHPKHKADYRSSSPGMLDSDDDGSSSDESDREEDDDRRLQEILAAIKSDPKKIILGKFDLTDDKQVEGFLAWKGEHVWGHTWSKKQNLLHLIADEDKNKLPSTKLLGPFIRALIQNASIELLKRRDSNGKTPLNLALDRRNHRLVKLMCRAHSDVNSILCMPRFENNPRSGNCIHKAVTNKESSKDDDLLRFLIERSEEKTLSAVDEQGRTPLHLAVDYKYCDQAQLGIVQALIARCDTALDQMCTVKNHESLSPYRYHVFTYDGRSTGIPPRRVIQSVREEGRHREEGRSRRERGTRGYLKANLPDNTLQYELDEDRVSANFEASTFHQDDRMGPLEDLPNEAVTPATHTESQTQPPHPRHKKAQPTEEAAQNIKQYLKEYCLRERDHERAVELLYGADPDRQIYFDLSGVSPDLSYERIRSGLRHVIFEDILQYVAIPSVKMDDNSTMAAKAYGQPAPKPDGTGRKDLLALFKWLKVEKGVKKILRIIVDDLHEPAHKDDVIENCLVGLTGIEEWDWKKFDLSPDVIQSLAPNAKIVHLYWNGNNTTLRGWSEPEGLHKLHKLERVCLHYRQGLESRERMSRSISEFIGRVEKDTKIKVSTFRLAADLSEHSNSGPNLGKDNPERHRWVTTMEEFADVLQNAERISPMPKLETPIMVALIDDGVDINDHTIQDKIIGGRSFCRRDTDQNLNLPYYVSGGGHGTAMAGFICKICPNARLFILRLDEFSAELGSRRIRASSAEKAVRAAMKKNVDIISMSWSIEKDETNKEAIALLELAIADAARQNILMFCAATDQGAVYDRSYPAATSGTKGIFKIGAATAPGTPTTWVGQLSRIDFLFPGYQVALDRQDDPGLKKPNVSTGSSVATALASGLAAVLLYIVKLAEVVRNGQKADFSKYRALKTHEAMREAFTSIGTTKETDHKYIMVWEKFKKPAQDFQGDARVKWMDNQLLELAETFTRHLV